MVQRYGDYAKCTIAVIWHTAYQNYGILLQIMVSHRTDAGI